MTARKILIINGHPDPDPARFVHALASAYERGASEHEVRHLKVGELDYPFLRSSADWMSGKPTRSISKAQADIAWAEHILILYPLWLGDVPALLKGFLEHTMRPGFALAYREHGLPKKLLKGRTARVVVTMGMPAFFYKLFYGAHSVKSLERNVLRFVGIRPKARMILGGVEGGAKRRQAWLKEMESLGRSGK